jgi:hypothetical protein
VLLEQKSKEPFRASISLLAVYWFYLSASFCLLAMIKSLRAVFFCILCMLIDPIMIAAGAGLGGVTVF